MARDVCGKKVATIKSPTRLIYRAAGDIVDDVGVLCRRVKAARLDAKVLGSGPDRIVIEVPSKDVRGALAVTRTGELAFYDWEANVIGPSGKPDPADLTVTGGQAAGSVGSLGHYDAVLRAAKRPANVEANNGRRGSRYYAVDPQAGKVFGSGAATRAGALADVPAAKRQGAKVREVQAGTVVLRGEQAAGVAVPEDGYFVLRDDVALRGRDIRDPEQNFANGPGRDGAPVVTFQFSPAGAKAFAAFTKTIAKRGSRSVGLLPGATAAAANQHFAIVVDDQIVSVPYIDFRSNPDGIDGSTGSLIQGGFTIASARQLATVLKTGALPVALELVTTTP